SPRRLLLRPDPPRGLRVGAPLEPGRARAAVRGSRQLRPAGAGPGRVDLASQYGALHPDGARDDGGSARRGPRARPPQLGRALGAYGGLPAVRVIGRRSRARVAVDVPHRFRRDQLDAVARRCGARGLARESEHRPDRLDDRLPVGTGRLSDDRVPRRTAGDSTGLPRRGARGRRRRLATVPDDHLAVAQAGDALRVRHRHHQLVSGLHVRLRSHGRRSRAHHENFPAALTALPFDRFFLNSAILATCVVVGQLFTSATAAYAFARLRFPGRDRLFLCFLSVLLVPALVLLVPRFLIVNALGWVDSYAGLISTELVSVWGMLLLRP